MENKMKEIEKILNSQSKRFDDVEIQQEESNTDKFIKIKIIEILNEKNIKAEKYEKGKHGYKKVKPDLVVEVYNEKVFFEIKTSKKNNGVLPGSSVQQINLLEPTIFWNRESNEFKVDYYYIFLTGEIPFPDRSPRPTIRFNGNKIEYEDAKKMIDDWQEYLSSIWLDRLNKENTKWFDITIDNFVLKLMDLEENERNKLIKIIKDRSNN